MGKTKNICTIGPASKAEEICEECEGIMVARGDTNKEKTSETAWFLRFCWSG